MDLALAPTVAAPGEARRAVRSSFQDLTLEELTDLETVVTELVTNAVLHGGGPGRDPIGLHVLVTTDAIKGTVSDQGAGFDRHQLDDDSRRGDTSTGGWGLQIVDALTHSWDVRSGDLNEVTFSMSRST